MRKKKSIFVLLPSLEMGGAERVAINFLSKLNDKKFSRCLVVLGSNDGPLLDDIPDGVKTIFLDKKRVRHALWILFLLLRKYKPDLVFSNLSHLNLAVAMFRFALPKNIKVVARESNIVSRNVTSFPISSLYSLLYKIFYNQLDLVFCQTPEMACDLIENYNVDNEKIRVINNPIDQEYINKMAAKELIARENKRTMIACGRLDFQKGFDILLQALALIPNTDYRVLIIGDGNMRSSLELQALQLGLSDNVSFLGFKSNPYPYIASSDCIVSSSRFEGMPNILLEALALGKPVISTPSTRSLTDLLLKCNASIIATDSDHVSLSSAIIEFLELPSPPKENAQVIQPYLIENVIIQFEDSLDQIC